MAVAIEIDIQSNIDEVVASLNHLGAQTKYIKIDMLRKTAQGALVYVKNTYKMFLRKNTGGLFKSIKYRIGKQRDYAVGFSTKYYAAAAHENGLKIDAKKFKRGKENYKYMTFRVGGSWVKTKSIQLKKSPFFEVGFKRYHASKMQEDMDSVLAKAIEKFNAGKV